MATDNLYMQVYECMNILELGQQVFGYFAYCFPILL